MRLRQARLPRDGRLRPALRGSRRRSRRPPGHRQGRAPPRRRPRPPCQRPQHRHGRAVRQRRGARRVVPNDGAATPSASAPSTTSVAPSTCAPAPSATTTPCSVPPCSFSTRSSALPDATTQAPRPTTNHQHHTRGNTMRFKKTAAVGAALAMLAAGFGGDDRPAPAAMVRRVRVWLNGSDTPDAYVEYLHRRVQRAPSRRRPSVRAAAVDRHRRALTTALS